MVAEEDGVEDGEDDGGGEGGVVAVDVVFGGQTHGWRWIEKRQ